MVSSLVAMDNREESLARTAARYVADQPHDFGSSLRLSPVNTRYLRQSFAEDLAWTGGISAAEAADPHTQLDSHTLPGQVLKATAIAAVTGS